MTAVITLSLCPPTLALGNPNYWDWGHYGLSQGGYQGVYATVSPYAVNFDTDPFSSFFEYWVQVSVHWDYHYYAEVGLDVTYERNVYTGQLMWHTRAFAAYNDDGGSQGTVIAYSELGYSFSGPTSATIATYQTSGSSWSWYVNGYVFATHSFPEYWQGYSVHSYTEAYHQPAAGTNGQTISETSNLAIRSVSTGQWVSPGIYQSGGVTSGWQVSNNAQNGYRSDWSTRS